MPQYGLGPRPGGNASELNITAPTVVKASPGTLFRVNVNTASSVSVSACYDLATVNGASAATEIYVSPISAVGSTELTWPCADGILIVPGTGANIAVSYS